MIIVKDDNHVNIICYTKTKYDCFMVNDFIDINNSIYKIISRIYKPEVDTMTILVEKVNIE